MQELSQSPFRGESRGMRRTRKGVSLAGAAAAVILAAGTALAGSPVAPFDVASADPFSNLVGKSRGRPHDHQRDADVERFVVAGDTRVFLVEGGVGAARIKYLCSAGDRRLDCRIDPEGPAEEIYLVSGERGPRGDTIYKDAQGEVLLRITSYGGATVYWPGERQGQAASRSFGDDAALQLPPADFAAAQRRARMATATLSALTGAPIVFEIGDGRGEDARVLADAVARAAAGMGKVASDPTGARILAARIERVYFEAGGSPGLSLENGVLTLIYDPSAGLEGRPGSGAVARFLEETL